MLKIIQSVMGMQCILSNGKKVKLTDSSFYRIHKLWEANFIKCVEQKETRGKLVTVLQRSRGN